MLFRSFMIGRQKLVRLYVLYIYICMYISKYVFIFTVHTYTIIPVSHVDGRNPAPVDIVAPPIFHRANFRISEISTQWLFLVPLKGGR